VLVGWVGSSHRFDDEVRVEFFRSVDQGLTARAAARVVSVSEGTKYWWSRQVGISAPSKEPKIYGRGLPSGLQLEPIQLITGIRGTSRIQAKLAPHQTGTNNRSDPLTRAGSVGLPSIGAHWNPPSPLFIAKMVYF
jgi:hypothetical protein